VKVSGGATLARTVKSGSSYLSQSQLPVTFGSDSSGGVERITSSGRAGRKDTLSNVRANQLITVQEGRGLVPGAGR